MRFRWRAFRPSHLLRSHYVLVSLGYRLQARFDRAAVPVPIGGDGFDFVTVVYGGELGLLRLQARSLARYLPSGFDGRIHVIVNDLACRATATRIRREVLPDYGPWRDRVDIVPFHALGVGLDPFNGWMFQQALKLAIASRVRRPYYVVLDAKNHACRPIDPWAFVTAAGRARQEFHADGIGLPAHFAACSAYFGLSSDACPPCRPMTPFVMRTEVVRDLVALIERRERTSLFDFFCFKRLMSEFLLYRLYLFAERPDVEADFYEEAAPLGRTLWPQSTCAEQRDFYSDIEEDTDALFFGVHREVLEGLCSERRDILYARWRQWGLIGPGETVTARRILPAITPRRAAPRVVRLPGASPF